MKFYHKSKLYVIAKDIWSILLTISLIVYLSIGFVLKIWHPTWLIFVGTIVISLAVYFILMFVYKKVGNLDENSIDFEKFFETSGVYPKCVKVSGWIFIISVALYITSASFSGLWHPLWLIFLVMAVIEQVITLMFKIKLKHEKVASVIEVNEEK